EESREVRRREVAGAGGPAVVLELERLRRRDHAVSRGIRGHELHDRLVERLPHDGPRLLASEELRADPVVGAPFPPSAERHTVVRTLARHAFARCAARYLARPRDTPRSGRFWITLRRMRPRIRSRVIASRMFSCSFGSGLMYTRLTPTPRIDAASRRW